MDSVRHWLLHTHRGAKYSTSVPAARGRSATGAGPTGRCLGRAAADRRADRGRTGEERRMPVTLNRRDLTGERGDVVGDDAGAIDCDAAKQNQTRSCSQQIWKSSRTRLEELLFCTRTMILKRAGTKGKTVEEQGINEKAGKRRHSTGATGGEGVPGCASIKKPLQAARSRVFYRLVASPAAEIGRK